MKRELADFIIKACENNDCLFFDRGLELPELRENYQGRGHSKPSFAITFKGSFFVIMAAIAVEAFELGDDYDAAGVDLSQISKLDEDSLGLCSVIY